MKLPGAVESSSDLCSAPCHPSLPGPVVFLVEFQQALLAGGRPKTMGTPRNLPALLSGRLLAIEPLELEGFLQRQTDQDAPAQRIHEIAPRRIVRRASQGAPSPAIHRPRNGSRRRPQEPTRRRAMPSRAERSRPARPSTTVLKSDDMTGAHQRGEDQLTACKIHARSRDREPARKSP